MMSTPRSEQGQYDFDGREAMNLLCEASCKDDSLQPFNHEDEADLADAAESLLRETYPEVSAAEPQAGLGLLASVARRFAKDEFESFNAA